MPDLVVTVPKDFWPDWIAEGGRLRGYAPVTRVALAKPGQWAICRQGGAVACTIDGEIRGFQGFRQRWWDRELEMPFPGWEVAGVPPRMLDYMLAEISVRWTAHPEEFQIAAKGKHPFAEAILRVTELSIAARLSGKSAPMEAVVKHIAEHLHVDLPSAELYVARAVAALRRWGALT